MPALIKNLESLLAIFAVVSIGTVLSPETLTLF